ncbi:MAG: hypothetical protein K2Y56_22755 [Methylobacterium sp.]|uniref:hypothetical protein n=1 Tax=Methylobacterium sp. TaxID=409 RepID=UPI0025EB271F|nr:hypothetical protein [Methylobacterium sp.]MBX9934301.1 hypothetical protein [Methylobacterium sp.]
MPVESWMQPDDVPALAAVAKDRIDLALSRLDEAEREAFWASIRKCYNTPYNDPKPRTLVRSEVLEAPQPCTAPIAPSASDLASLAAMPPASLAPEHRVA